MKNIVLCLFICTMIILCVPFIVSAQRETMNTARDGTSREQSREDRISDDIKKENMDMNLLADENILRQESDNSQEEAYPHADIMGKTADPLKESIQQENIDKQYDLSGTKNTSGMGEVYEKMNDLLKQGQQEKKQAHEAAVTAGQERLQQALSDVDSKKEEIVGKINDAKHNQGDEGIILFGTKEASLAGTSGVALVEAAKDQSQTTASNVTSVSLNAEQNKKNAERKIGDK